MSKAQEAQQFLDDLESWTPSKSSGQQASKQGGGGTPKAPPADAADAIAFLDEITQKSAEPTKSTLLERPLSRAGTPTLRKSTERVRMSAPGMGSSPIARSESGSGSTLRPTSAASTAAEAPSDQAKNGGWGWSGMGSVWSSASVVLQQARSVVEEQAKNLPSNEQAMRLGGGVLNYAKTAQASAQEYAKSAQEYAKTAQLDKITQDFRRVGLSTLTDILNVVAPPITEHEVLQVWLSHDMKGYEGVETIVYKALAKVMEQVEGGDLVVNRGDELKPKSSAGPDAREMNAVEGFEAALKLAQAEVADLLKRNAKPDEPPKAASADVPVTHSYIYLRVQPYTSSFVVPAAQPDAAPATTSTLQFILHLTDPEHKLSKTTITQAIPKAWLDVWDKYEWVEDNVVDTIRAGIEVLGQDYVAARMQWVGEAPVAEAVAKAKGEAEEEEDDDSEEEESDEEEEAPPQPTKKK